MTLTRKTGLRRVSPKRRTRNVIYEAAKKIWRAGHDGRCEMMLNDDGSPAPREPHIIGTNPSGRCKCRAMNQPHHMKGNLGGLLYAVEWFLGVCFTHHRWIHDNERQATALGYLAREKPKH